MRFVALLVLPVLLVLPLLASAQVTDIPRVSPIVSPSDILDTLGDILGFVFVVVGILAVLALLISAMLYITAGGNEDRRKSAGSWLKYGIVGIIVAIIAGSIIPIVQSFLEFDI